MAMAEKVSERLVLVSMNTITSANTNANEQCMVFAYHIRYQRTQTQLIRNVKTAPSDDDACSPTFNCYALDAQVNL